MLGAIVGELVVWTYSEELPDFMGFADTVRWYSTAPYEGGPSELLVPEKTSLLTVTGTEVVFAGWSDPTILEWRDLAGDPAVVVRSSDVPGVWVTVDGSLVSYADEAVTESWLVDADGLPITADGTPAPPRHRRASPTSLPPTRSAPRSPGSPGPASPPDTRTAPSGAPAR